jgi:hypothetical protein
MRNYKSKFENKIGDLLGEYAEYEPEKLYFVQPEQQRYYLPDFKTKTGIYIECKGKWVAEDRKKHVWLRQQYPDKRIILVFQNSNVKINKRSKTTYGDWATKNNMEWLDFSKHGIPEELYKNEIKETSRKRRRKQPSSRTRTK